jgi:hypothetical protein
VGHYLVSRLVAKRVVIPGRCAAPNPESRFYEKRLDSGFRPAAGPGMTRKNGRAYGIRAGRGSVAASTRAMSR